MISKEICTIFTEIVIALISQKPQAQIKGREREFWDIVERHMYSIRRTLEIRALVCKKILMVIFFLISKKKY